MTLTAPFVRSLSACLQLGLVCGIESGSSGCSGSSGTTGSLGSLDSVPGPADCTAPSWLANFVAFSAAPPAKSQSKSQINRFIELMRSGSGPGLHLGLFQPISYFTLFYSILYPFSEKNPKLQLFFMRLPQVFRCVFSSDFPAVSLFSFRALYLYLSVPSLCTIFVLVDLYIYLSVFGFVEW